MSEFYGLGQSDQEHLPYGTNEIAEENTKLVMLISGLMDDGNLTEEERRVKAIGLIEEINSGVLTIDSFKGAGEQ